MKMHPTNIYISQWNTGNLSFFFLLITNYYILWNALSCSDVSV
jgi:hypothetical protein